MVCDVCIIGDARSLSIPQVLSLSASFLVTLSWRISVRIRFCLDRGRLFGVPFSIRLVAVSSETDELIDWKSKLENQDL